MKVTWWMSADCRHFSKIKLARGSISVRLQYIMSQSILSIETKILMLTHAQDSENKIPLKETCGSVPIDRTLKDPENKIPLKETCGSVPIDRYRSTMMNAQRF